MSAGCSHALGRCSLLLPEAQKLSNNKRRAEHCPYCHTLCMYVEYSAEPTSEPLPPKASKLTVNILILLYM